MTQSKTVSITKALPLPDRASSIGYTAALAATVLGLLYLLGTVASLLSSGSVSAPAGLVRFISGGVALIWNPVLVILFAALRHQVQEARKIYAELAVVFMAMLCVTSSINWFVQVTVAPAIAQAGNPAITALIDPFQYGSILYAVEHLGWGLFFGIGCLFAAFTMEGGRLDGDIRWLLAAAGIFGLLHVLGMVASQPVLYFLAYPAWGLLLPTACALLTVRFRRNETER
jgi:hypothetical protein